MPRRATPGGGQTNLGPVFRSGSFEPARIPEYDGRYYNLAPYIEIGNPREFLWCVVAKHTSFEDAAQIASLATPVVIGWRVFDPQPGQPAEWELQRAKNQLLHLLYRPGRWVLDGDVRTLAELVPALLASGFALHHIHAALTGERPRHYELHEGRLVGMDGSDITRLRAADFASVYADEQHHTRTRARGIQV